MTLRKKDRQEKILNNSRRRDFCFTINNYTDDDEELLVHLKDDKRVRYLIVGKEKGEQEETPHIQGYVYFHNPIAFSTLKSMLPRSHIEACKGNPQSNIEYCSKEGKFKEFGERPVNQKRKGELGREFWEEQLEYAKKGKFEEIDPKIQLTHDLALQRIAARYMPKPPDLDIQDKHHLWYWGPTGTGKSSKVRADYKGEDIYLKMCNKWWDDYNGEKVVLIEDFDKRHDVLGHHLKIWADRYSFRAEIKGGSRQLRPELIIITSNWHPMSIWQGERETLEPILRRFTVIQFPINLPSP